ncbi:MAG: hypothetical protein ACK5LX_16485 [Oscillospiraceae bacterium]
MLDKELFQIETELDALSGGLRRLHQMKHDNTAKMAEKLNEVIKRSSKRICVK